MNVPNGYMPALAVIRLAYDQYGGDDLENLAGDMEINPDNAKPMDPAMAEDWEEACSEHKGLDALIAFLKEYVSRNEPSDAGMAAFMTDLQDDNSQMYGVAHDALSP